MLKILDDIVESSSRIKEATVYFDKVIEDNLNAKRDMYDQITVKKLSFEKIE
jgi:hypothetical protein